MTSARLICTLWFHVRTPPFLTTLPSLRVVHATRTDGHQTHTSQHLLYSRSQHELRRPHDSRMPLLYQRPVVGLLDTERFAAFLRIVLPKRFPRP